MGFGGMKYRAYSQKGKLGAIHKKVGHSNFRFQILDCRFNNAWFRGQV
jgi:hypothetical protein